MKIKAIVNYQDWKLETGTQTTVKMGPFCKPALNSAQLLPGQI